MQILYIDNGGAGFANHIDIPEGTTVSALFEDKMSGRKPADFLIRVNRQPASADQLLRAGDRVSITPQKIEGALAA